MLNLGLRVKELKGRVKLFFLSQMYSAYLRRNVRMMMQYNQLPVSELIRKRERKLIMTQEFSVSAVNDAWSQATIQKG